MNSYLSPSRPPLGPRRSDVGTADLDVVGIVRATRRRWKTLAASLALTLAAGTAYLAITPPSYTAAVRLLIDPSRVSGALGARSDANAEKAYIDTQVELLDSPELAQAVVRSLNLSDDKELSSLSLYERLRSLIPGNEPSLLTQERQIEHASLAFANRSRVGRVGVSYLVEINYTSGDAVHAADMANALANTYIGRQTTAARQANERLAQALDSEISRLAEAHAIAEGHLRTFRGASNFASSQTDDARENAALQSLETAIRSARESARAVEGRLQAVSGVIGADPARVLDLPLSDLPNGEAIAALSRGILRGTASGADLEAMRATLVRELERVRADLRDALTVAEEHAAALDRDLTTASSRRAAAAAQRAELAGLEARSRLQRELLDERLRRKAELALREEGEQTGASIASPAFAPPGKSAPRTTLILGGAIFLGLVGGGSLILLGHLLNRTIASPADVRNLLGINCLGIIPRRRRFRGKAVIPQRNVITAPHGADERAFRDILRTIALTADMKVPVSPCTIGILSARQGEGRTMIAVNLAAYLAATEGAVLLVDFDTLHPGISAAPIGRAAAPTGEKILGIDVLHDPSSGCDLLLLAEAGPHLPSPTALRTALDNLGTRYSHIIFDLPPTSARAETLTAVTCVQSFVLVIAADRTPHEAVADALAATPSVAERLLGAVLT